MGSKDFHHEGLRNFTNVGHDLFEVGLTNVGSLISP